MEWLSEPRLQALLDTMRNARVAVVGDFCLDVYWFLDTATRDISLETGKPTSPVREQRCSLGGAGNVVANLAALGVGTIHAVGVVGRDPFGEQVLELLRREGAHSENMVRGESSAWQTLAYCKPYAGEEELSRIDMGRFNALPESLALDLLRRIERLLPEVDLVIVNQQVPTGIHTPALRAGLRVLMERHAARTFLYDGRQFAEGYPLAWLKVNAHEAVRLSGGSRASDEQVSREEAVGAAAALYGQRKRPVFVTRGARGVVVQTGEGTVLIPGLQLLDPIDPVGAGDSFLAALAAALAVGASATEAAQMGNLAAGVTVTKLRQTGTASPAEILTIGRAPDYVYEPELAEDPRRAEWVAGTGIEVVAGGWIPPPRPVEIAIFDHDGTISTLRQGWEDVMVPMMVRAVLGDRSSAADEAVFHRVEGRVQSYVEQTTGIQTLVQMEGLARMVREFGFVPADQVLDAAGYKAIYNAALMDRVRRRRRRIEAGDLDAADFTIRSAALMLEALHRAGVRLYLASGTDQSDVEAEARALGYADRFQGRVFGAVGDVTQDAKRIVLDRIMAEIGDLRGRVVTFGDGPVEIRETRRRGGLAVGVASDEVRRFDPNPAKRARLIRAGAVMIIPDFSEWRAILRLLHLSPPPGK